MSLPDGFVSVPAVGFASPDVVGCWAGENRSLLCVQRMHAVLGHERLKSSDLPPRSQLMTVKWSGFDIDAIRTDTAAATAGGPITIYTAQVPLRREAIQVVAAGPTPRSTETLATLNQVLGSLKGETNWISATGRASRAGTIVGWLVGIAIGVLIVRMVVTRRKPKEQS
jgi:hypothetical protein